MPCGCDLIIEKTYNKQIKATVKENQSPSCWTEVLKSEHIEENGVYILKTTKSDCRKELR